MFEFNSLALAFLGFIILQRISELVISKRNTATLLRQGAYEVGAKHYPIMVLMHTSWIVLLVIFGINQPISLAWLSLFIVLQFFRFWILGSLGRRWTTRIIILEQPLVVKGPFKYFNHPNYMLVVAEIFVAPMVLGLTWLALLFTLLNAAMLWVRIGVEEAALKKLR